VTLIELFAWMTDQLVYRLNRVPDRNYVKFLELLGVQLFPPTPARGELTFWLSAPRPDAILAPERTQVSSRRVEGEDPVVFTTDRELAIAPCSVAVLASANPRGETRRQPLLDDPDTSVFCFSRIPEPGDVFLVGLSNAVPSCVVTLRIDAHIEGIGVDPANPPLVWEAWTGAEWEPCELERDDTGGLNRAGDVVLHVPDGHERTLVSGDSAGWIRCRVRPVEEGQPFYSASPELTRLEAFTVGGRVPATHAQVVVGELLGLSDGAPGQRFTLELRPVVPQDEPRVLEVITDEGREEWEEVTTFADSGPESRHFVLDQVAGELQLGPAVREPDGTLRRFGAVPPKDSLLRLRSYLTGGGPRGNVAKGVLTVLRKPIPYVTSVENRRPAAGGVDGEDVENAKLRGPLTLRTGDRAVTADDYEQLAREAAPEVARVAAVGAEGETEAGGVRVLVVPAVPDTGTRIRLEQLVPNDETLQRIARHLDSRRVIGVRISVEPPLYFGVTVVARLAAALGADAARVQRDSLRALNGYFDPLRGGPNGGGWPFGRDVLSGEVYALLQNVRGVETVEDVRVFPADPTSGVRAAQVDRIELPRYALAFSYEHRVLVEAL
jgi:predicted phage baseplate assembly protein